MNDCAELLAELGISLQLIVERGLCVHPEAGDLVIAEIDAAGREHSLIPAAAVAWQALKQAAAADGVDLFIVSAHRSIVRQAELVRRKLDAGQTIDDILLICAPPGYSEHHSGRAIDVGNPDVPPLVVEFERTPAFAWLTAHAGTFGFRLSYPPGNAQGFTYEPWHWYWYPQQ